MQGLTVLVVHELVSFRESVCGMLQATPFRVVGEPADGWDAVQMAKELQPDLILLGLGLPKLHGLETARRLRTLAPQARLLFLSQESSPDLVREALRDNARITLQLWLDSVIPLGQSFVAL